MRLLGVDYGAKRIGLAISDEAGDFAFPLAVLANKNLNNSVNTISEICRKERVGRVIVGESRDFKGQRNKIMDQIDVFVGALKQKGLEIILELEFYTSAEADRVVVRRSHRDEGGSRKEKHKSDTLDASAAAIILRSYIERQKNSPTS